MKYGREKLEKKVGLVAPEKQSQSSSIHFGVNKTFVSEGLSQHEFSEQNPLGENRKDFYDLNDIEDDTLPVWREF